MLALTLLVLLTPFAAHATAQVANLLLIDGVSHALWSEPIHDSNLVILSKPMAAWPTSTACYAGYRTVWSISKEHLWFLGTKECHGDRQLSARDVVLVSDTQVPADWYSGTLVLPQGELVHYVHGGWASLYSSERRITIASGVVTGDEVVQTVASGFAVLDTLWFQPGILVPADIVAGDYQFVNSAADPWIVFSGATPTRNLRIKLDIVKSRADPTSWRVAVDAALTAHLHELEGPREYLDLGEQGVVGWVDQEGGEGTLQRVFAWANQERIRTFVLELPDNSIVELDAFTKQLSIPLW